jgi:hypothetical protein
VRCVHPIQGSAEQYYSNGSSTSFESFDAVYSAALPQRF